MAVTVATFRAQFSEFGDSTVTPDATIQTWIDASAPMFDPCRWDDLLDTGTLYWVAHSITLAKANALQPVLDDAVMKKVGDIQKQRDPGLMMEAAKNPYLRTTYGQQFLYYMRLAGAGGFAV